MSAAPTGLQLDLLTAIVRLEQIGRLIANCNDLPADLWLYLLEERVIKCDVPRLRGHLAPETLAWEAENADDPPEYDPDDAEAQRISEEYADAAADQARTEAEEARDGS
jgi:hypothetical protein